MAANDHTIGALRAVLFETIAQVRDGSIEADQARGVNELSKRLIELARVETDYLKESGGGASTFMEPEKTADEQLPAGITQRTVHRIRG